MSDGTSKAEKLAQNAVLTLIARAAMVLGTPLVVGLLGWVASVLLDLRAEQGRQAGQIQVLETRLSARIAAIEDRQGAQSRRMDLTDTRIERLAELTGKFSVDTAVLAEQIRALIAASQPASRQPGQR